MFVSNFNYIATIFKIYYTILIKQFILNLLYYYN